MEVRHEVLLLAGPPRSRDPEDVAAADIRTSPCPALLSSRGRRPARWCSGAILPSGRRRGSRLSPRMYSSPFTSSSRAEDRSARRRRRRPSPTPKRRRARFFIRLDERAVIGAELLADGRVDAGGAAAGLVPGLVGTDHVPHVRGGPADVGDDAGPAGDHPLMIRSRAILRGLELRQDDVATLVLGDAAERGSPRRSRAGWSPEKRILLPTPGSSRRRTSGAGSRVEGQLVLGIDRSTPGARRRGGQVDVDARRDMPRRAAG